MSARSRTRKLRMEQMEARQMMAGDLIAINTTSTSGLTFEPADPGDTSIPVVQELNLNSLPGAKATIFLDFNGHFQQERMFDTAGVGGHANILTPAFDTDGNPNSFSADEQQEIRSLWALVAEDYAPFNVNVTTVDPDPGLLHLELPYLRVVISGDGDFTGNGLAGASEKDWTGGYNAYADDGDPNVVYVFQKNSSGGNIGLRHMAESASHEAAHAFGVDHYDPDTHSTSRASIMEDDGATQAIRGVWADDDMQIIASSDNGFGMRADDVPGSIAKAYGMTTTNAGLFRSGIINWHTDVDMFRFETGGGDVTIKLELPNVPFLGGVGNLDAKLQLFNSSGVLKATVDDADKLDATLKTNLTAGTYYIGVGSHGIYGDVGQYSITVTETTGAHIVGSQFQKISSTVMGLTVTFNEPINPLTFTVGDVRINNGAIGAGVLSVQMITSKQFLIQYTISGAASHSVTIGPNILDQFGNKMDQNKNGIKGESTDEYRANYFESIAVSPITATQLKKTSLTAVSVDAFFSRA